MKILDYFKNVINKFKIKNKEQLLLNSPKNNYKDLISSFQINTIINNIPQNLSNLEKAYYIYLELGKILSENPKFVFSNIEDKIIHYNDDIDSQYYGICKSISELYVDILNDDRIGISAESVKKTPESPITHIDTILKIDGKNYIANLISDLSRIKTSRRVNSFCFDLNRLADIPEDETYKNRLRQHYGKINCLSRKDIEILDKKLGYSFFMQYFPNDERGIYTEDTIELLKKEMDNPELFKKYILHNKDVPKEEWLKYKMNYIFENINKFTNYNGKMNYLENIRYYLYVAKKLLSKEECSRIQSYAATIGNDFSNIISILKVRHLNSSNNQNDNIYFLYSTKDRRYIEKTPEEMKLFIDSLDKDSLHIIGTFDKFNPRETSELEL